MYKTGDKILQISSGVFVRLGIIVDKTNTEYQVEWLEKGIHVENLSSRNYPFNFIENTELFDLITKTNIEQVIKKYIDIEDFETCEWIRDNLLNNYL
jgi:hypothetical protein